MNILITSAGRRVSLVRAFQRELTREFPAGKVFTTDMNPILSPACNISDKAFAVEPITNRNYVSHLLQICRDNSVSMVIPTIDTELQVLAENKELFFSEGVSLIVSAPEFIAKCRDKRLINEFFKERGIEVPSPIDKHAPKFPLFIKPYDGSLSTDIYLIRSAADLTDYHVTNERFMFMEYIDKDEHDEYTIDMYYGKDNIVKSIVPRKRIVVRAGEVNKGLTEKNILVSFCKEKLGYIEGAIGCLTLQAFLNKNTLRIIAIEINPRFGGGYPLSYSAGANYPAWLIKEYLIGECINYSEDWEDHLLMLRYDDEILVHGYQA